MRFAQLFEATRRDPEMPIPLDRIQRLRASFRRRLVDDVEDVFRRACTDKDLQAAAGLFAVTPARQQPARRRRAAARPG